MRYTERPAGPWLRSLVDRFWGVETDASDPPMPSPILPDGHVEVMVHVGVPFAEVDSRGNESRQARVLLGAQMTEAVRLVAPPSGMVVGARLRPYAGALLTGVPQDQLTGRIHELASIDARLAERFSQHVSGRPDLETAMQALEMVLTVEVATSASRRRNPPPAALMQAVMRALKEEGLVRVDDLASDAGLSARQLERQFAHHVGLSPKRFLRITRFQQVLAALRAPGESRWPDLAVRLGYYDQAHFINDFRSFTGESPGAWEIDDASLTAVFAGRGVTDDGPG